MSRGALVSLEGGEGAGKSSALASLRERIEARGLGVIALNGKMIDAPVIAHAERVLQRAAASGVSV